MSNIIKVLVTGGFDPLHAGHVNMIRAAAHIGGEVTALYVGLNSDDWLMRKKGYVFMPFEERKFIIESLRYVDCVVAMDDSDDTAIATIESVRPHYFVNSGDRKPGELPEDEICAKLGIRSVWIGSHPYQAIHSSELILSACEAIAYQNRG